MSRSRQDPRSDLAALADGSLARARARELEEEVAASPRLAALLAEQHRAIALIGTVQTPAPDRLRARVETLAAKSGATRGDRRPRPGVGGVARRLGPRVVRIGALATAAVAAALVLVLPGGAAGPTVVQAASLAQRPATLPAPAQDPGHANLLARTEAGVSYPDWQERFGWRAVGARTDRLTGRHATTVFYTGPHRWRIGYAIVAGKALPAPAGASVVVRDGVRLAVAHGAGGTIVTWVRSGHSCVLSGSVAPGVLEQLASWRAPADTSTYL